jgi:hypothetical protein
MATMIDHSWEVVEVAAAAHCTGWRAIGALASAARPRR